MVQMDVPGKPFGAIFIRDGTPVCVLKQETIVSFFRGAFFVVVGTRSANAAL